MVLEVVVEQVLRKQLAQSGFLDYHSKVSRGKHEKRDESELKPVDRAHMQLILYDATRGKDHKSASPVSERHEISTRSADKVEVSGIPNHLLEILCHVAFCWLVESCDFWP